MILVAVLVVLVVAAGLVYYLFFRSKDLSHTAVEKAIAKQYKTSGVTCNGGKNFTLDKKGDTFGCTDSDGKKFTVTITDADNGTYKVG